MTLRRLLLFLGSLMGTWLGASLLVGWLLPGLLLHPPCPARTPQEQRARLEEMGQGGSWTRHPFLGPDGTPLTLYWLHRQGSPGVVLYLHGFGDDAFGTLGYARQLPEWDAAAFTFRGRDRDPSRMCTLGARERGEVAAAVAFLERQGARRSHILLAGVSQGAGVALLALNDLERTGGPLAGALLETPFRDLQDAARHHLEGPLGPFEPMARLAESLALARAGRLAGFNPDGVSPLKAARGLRTPLAFLSGAADPVTPLAGVRSIAREAGAPLTIVPGAGHCEAGLRVPGGWGAWARLQLRKRGGRTGGSKFFSFPLISWCYGRDPAVESFQPSMRRRAHNSKEPSWRTT